MLTGEHTQQVSIERSGGVRALPSPRLSNHRLDLVSKENSYGEPQRAWSCTRLRRVANSRQLSRA
jgi:hypothetical protein